MPSVTWSDALVVGAAQALALVPGASRSGVTITAGLFRGMSRETAARFSFLLSLPSVLAAGVYQLYKEPHALLDTQENAVALGAATLAALVVGYASIAFLLSYLKTHTTYIFIAYRLVVGGLILYWLANSTLTPLDAPMASRTATNSAAHLSPAGEAPRLVNCRLAIWPMQTKVPRERRSWDGSKFSRGCSMILPSEARCLASAWVSPASR